MLGGGKTRAITTTAPVGKPLWFINEIAIPYAGDDCLIWPFARTNGRYGKLLFGGRLCLAHRVVCEAVNGPPPSPAHEAAHTCGQGHDACVNPRHLRWRTPKQNTGEKADHGTQLRGSRVPTSKLTEADVRAIRSLRGALKQKEIADRYGVQPSVISRIFSGARWAWLD